MVRVVFAHALSLILALTGLSFALARGTQPEAGAEMVICSGVELVTIHIGADGEPIDNKHLCPDGNAMFLAAHTVPDMPEPGWRLIGLAQIAAPVMALPAPELTPSARGPPVLV